MKNNKAQEKGVKESKELALYFMKALVEVASESFLILDPDLRVILANPSFYKVFQVSPKQTEDKYVYDLGNRQWDIPQLRSMLEKILPEKKIVKDFWVEHVFETIGKKTMLLNARQIDSVQLIILAIEDITVRRELEQKLAEYTKMLETKIAERTGELSERIKELQDINKTMVGREVKMVELKKEIGKLKKQLKNGNGKNGNRNNGKGNN